MGPVAVSCDGQTPGVPSVLVPGFGPGACFAGRGAVPVLLLFAGGLWHGRAERGRPAGAVFS